MRSILCAFAMLMAVPASGQMSARQVGPGQIKSSQPPDVPMTHNGESFTRTLNEIIKNVISTRVDAEYSEGVKEEANRCIAACNRYQIAATKLRREVTPDGQFSQATASEFKQAGERYLLAERDFRQALPKKPYQLPGWKIGKYKRKE